jgi:putative pyruvate formate lyase activating enzyme
LVSPTIWSLQLIKVIKIAKKKGLIIPIVWNTNAYEKVETLKKLEGLIDIYLPDYKYSDSALGKRYSSCLDYPSIAQKAILEMYKQVGNLKISKEGIAQKGIIVRHLLLPNLNDNSIKCLKFVRQISPDIHLSLMSQYNPVYKALRMKELNRKVNIEEYQEIKSLVKKLDFKHGWFQEYESQECFNPDFSQAQPFNAEK